MKSVIEPFSTHRPWDELTHQAYRDQPLRGQYHFQLDESCNEAEKQAWRDWCKKYPNHWPGHVRAFIDRIRFLRERGSDG